MGNFRRLKTFGHHCTVIKENEQMDSVSKYGDDVNACGHCKTTPQGGKKAVTWNKRAI